MNIKQQRRPFKLRDLSISDQSDEALTGAAQAATIILDGVKADRWRILVGDDAHELDKRVRQAPEKAYTAEFYESFVKEVGWKIG